MALEETRVFILPSQLLIGMSLRGVEFTCYLDKDLNDQIPALLWVV
jgi:hypothetical protein